MTKRRGLRVKKPAGRRAQKSVRAAAAAKPVRISIKLTKEWGPLLREMIEKSGWAGEEGQLARNLYPRLNGDAEIKISEKEKNLLLLLDRNNGRKWKGELVIGPFFDQLREETEKPSKEATS